MNTKIFLARIALLSCAGAPSMLAAQSAPVAPSQLTPRSIAPMPQTRQIEPLPMPEAQSAPGEGASLPITLGDVRLDGAFPELASANATFIARVAHKRQTVNDLFDAARALEQAYAARGYILVRVQIPPQKLDPDQPVKVIVVDGFIEGLNLDQVPQGIRAAVARRLQPLVGQHHVEEHEIERRLLLAGDLAGLRLRSALARGDQMGGVRLIVEGALDRLSVNAGIDNRLPNSLGAWQWNASLAANNLLGLGDRVYLSAGSQLDMGRYGFPTSPFGILGGGVDLPIGSNGLMLSADGVHSRVQPHPLAGVPVTVGEFTRAQLHLVMPVIRTREQTLQITGTFSAIRQSLRATDFALTLNRDRYEAVRLGLDWQRQMQGANAALGVTLSQGLDGRAGTETLPLSRQGASDHFTNLDAQARIDVPVRGGTQLSFIARGQDGFGEPQLLSEQFGLDSPDGVSAYPAGSFSVDSGITLRGELSHWISPTPRGLAVQPYLLAAQGWGWLEGATALEQSYLTAHAFGGGARLGLSGKASAATLGFELGYTGGRNRPDGARATLTSSVKF